MDAVILYVNSADPEWQKAYQKYVGGPITPNRFRDWGTLPYLLRGIEKYLPFVEKVHLVVSSESQVPGWIDRENVHVVLHKDIMPAEYLPTFNSCGIELHIPYIEGLSEEFIYFNDDFFIINPCEPELFFKDGRPQMRFRTHRLKEHTSTFRRQCLTSTNIARSALGIPEDDDKYLANPHWPAPMRKSLCLEVLEKERDRINGTLSGIRRSENANQYLFTIYALLKGEGDDVELPFLYIETDKIPEICRALRTTDMKEICLNDSRYADFNEERGMLLAAFQEKFPEYSRFEKKPEEIIVAMTTYPARFLGSVQVWESVVNQIADCPFKCVLVLSEEEFPSKTLLPFGIHRLIKAGKLEILWHPRNIRSHLKLLPVIKKYPDAHIITIDDDMTKPQGWLQNMIDDHRKWPEDIISCSYTFYLDSQMEWRRMLDLKQKSARGKNNVPGLVFQFARICSGHGTFFPAHTFADDRFFDEEAAMRIVPTCDETWMWCFAMLSGRNFRQSSWVFDESAYMIEGTQKMETALWRTNRNIYDRLYADLFREVPEFRKELMRRQRMYVTAPAEDRKKYPYHAVITTDDPRKIDALLKMYQDKPNKIHEFEGAKLFPPGIE